jgi:hypothetical protein
MKMSANLTVETNSDLEKRRVVYPQIQPSPPKTSVKKVFYPFAVCKKPMNQEKFSLVK